MQDAHSTGPPALAPWELAPEIVDAASAPRIRRSFREYLLRYATPDSDIYGAELIFGELIANVVRYAPGPASFVVEWNGVHPTLLVVDTGPGFRQAPKGTLADPIAECGRGLELVRRIAPEVVIGSRPHGGAVIRVVLPVQRVH